MSEIRNLTKIENGMYELKIINEDNKYIQIKQYDKEQMKSNYNSLDLQYRQAKMALGDTNKKLKDIKVEDTPELRDMLKLMEKAALLDQKEKLEKQKKTQQEHIEMFESQMKEISSAIPEVLRNTQK
jgi:hypothetical protein